MMRELNSYLWPYISVLVVDANGSPRFALEDTGGSKCVPAYIFAVNALLEMSSSYHLNQNGSICRWKAKLICPVK